VGQVGGGHLAGQGAGHGGIEQHAQKTGRVGQRRGGCGLTGAWAEGCIHHMIISSAGKVRALERPPYTDF